MTCLRVHHNVKALCWLLASPGKNILHQTLPVPGIQVDLRSGHKIYALIVSRYRSAITVPYCECGGPWAYRQGVQWRKGQRRRRPATEHTEDNGLVYCGPAHSFFVYLFGLALHMRVAEYRTWPHNNRCHINTTKVVKYSCFLWAKMLIKSSNTGMFILQWHCNFQNPYRPWLTTS